MTRLRARMSSLLHRIRMAMPTLSMRGMIMTPVIAIGLLLVLMFILSLVPSSFPEFPSQETIRSEFQAQNDGKGPGWLPHH